MILQQIWIHGVFKFVAGPIVQEISQFLWRKLHFYWENIKSGMAQRPRWALFDDFDRNTLYIHYKADFHVIIESYFQITLRFSLQPFKIFKNLLGIFPSFSIYVDKIFQHYHTSSLMNFKNYWEITNYTRCPFKEVTKNKKLPIKKKTFIRY